MAVARVSAVAHAGAILLTEAVEATGIGSYLSEALAPWRKPFAVHDPGKIATDLAIVLGLGGDCCSDIDQLGAEPAVFGQVASKATVSRVIAELAGDAKAVVAAFGAARARARARVWAQTGFGQGADERRPLVIDIDATLVTSHSEKEGAAPTWKKGFGFHPILAFADHGAAGTGEPLAAVLRPGNAGANTAADHVQVTQAALRQLPWHAGSSRMGKNVLIRCDGAGGTKEFTAWLARQRLGYSVGFTLPAHTPAVIDLVERGNGWTPAHDADGQIRPGAFVAELTDLLDLGDYPNGMRVIVRKERPHPGAQLRFDDIGDWRLTAFATNTRTGGPGGQLADLELRHRARARVEDRIRIAKDTGLANLPLRGFAQNTIWCQLVMLAADLAAWTQELALACHEARRWEPKRLRYRLYAIPAVIVRGARRTTLRLSDRAPWADLVETGTDRLRAMKLATAPG